jgi:hypothetical protein
MAHARQVWLQAMKWREHEVRNVTYPLRFVVTPDGGGGLVPDVPETQISKYTEEVRSYYTQGLTYLANPDPISVKLAYQCFIRVSEIQRRTPLLPGEWSVEKDRKRSQIRAPDPCPDCMEMRLSEQIVDLESNCICPPDPEPYWTDKYGTPENLCGTCGHKRNSHLGEAPLKGMPKEDDSGWCMKPAGTCIFGGCKCAAFVEPG